MVMPPSMLRVVPVINPAPGEHRYRTAPAISSGRPVRFIGCRPLRKSRPFSSARNFRRFPAPKTPQDLPQHLCISRRQISSGNLYRWEFNKEGKHLSIPVSGPLVLDTVEMMIDVALQGFGLVYAPDNEENQQHVAAGRLVRVLADWSPTAPGFYLYLTYSVCYT